MLAIDKNVRSTGDLKTGQKPIFVESHELYGVNRLMSKRFSANSKK
ncbi:hypothetical protein D1BOALGB6SA_1220 [Olavius sp. associated proteobacterium Delta 1]|nr:hypothetical protein D1BOALGB6SA_1220 [Olavius sp. associated proteobacterium Delta 1]